MESILDVAEQTVDVFAGNDQAPLLGLVQLPMKSLRPDISF
jgi:hypothetical protein